MNKKIKKYSWIHELNKAALESQLLSEAKIYKNSIQLNETFGKTDPEYPDFQFQPGEYESITKRIQSLGDERSNEARRASAFARLGKSPVDNKPVGNAEAEKRQHDEVPEMIDTSYSNEVSDSEEEARQAAEIRAAALANRKERETAEDLAAEKDWEASQEAGFWGGYSGRSGEINPKINNFLRR